MSFTTPFGGRGVDLGNRMYEEFKTVSGNVCNGFFSIGEDGFGTREWPAFKSYLEDIKLLKGSFLNSDIVHVPRTANLRADSLARSARKQSFFVVHMDAKLPIWFTESIWVCKCFAVKKKTIKTYNIIICINDILAIIETKI